MEAAPHPWPALGVLLLREGFVTTEDLEEILAEQRDARKQRISGWRLGEILVERGVINADQIARLVAEQYELPFVELEGVTIDPTIAGRLPDELVDRFSALPIEIQADGSLLLAVSDPAAVLFSDELRRVVGMPLRFAVAAPAALKAAIVSARAEAATSESSDFDWPTTESTTFDLIRTPDAPDTPDTDDVHTPGAEVTNMASLATSSWPPLGTLLVRDGLVTEDELETALAQQRLSSNKRLGEILVERGAVTRIDIARVVAEQYELAFVDLAPAEVDTRISALLPLDIARRYSALPVRFEPDGSLLVAVADPTKVLDPEEILEVLGARFTFAVADPDAIEEALLRQRLGHSIGQDASEVAEAVDLAHIEPDPDVEGEVESFPADATDAPAELADEDAHAGPSDDASVVFDGEADVSWLESGLVADPPDEDVALGDELDHVQPNAEAVTDDTLLEALHPAGRRPDQPIGDTEEKGLEPDALTDLEEDAHTEHREEPGEPETVFEPAIAVEPEVAVEPEAASEPGEAAEPEQALHTVDHDHAPDEEPAAEPAETVEFDQADPVDEVDVTPDANAAEDEAVVDPERAASEPVSLVVALDETSIAETVVDDVDDEFEAAVAREDDVVEAVEDESAIEPVSEPDSTTEVPDEEDVTDPHSPYLSLAEAPSDTVEDAPETAGDEHVPVPELLAVTTAELVEQASTDSDGQTVLETDVTEEAVALDEAVTSADEAPEPETDAPAEVVESGPPGVSEVDVEPSALDLVVSLSVPESVTADRGAPPTAAPYPAPASDESIEDLLERARTFGASSVHFSAQQEGLVVRARVDGRMRELGLLTVEKRAAAERDLARLGRAERPGIDVRLLPTRNGTTVTVHLVSAPDWAATLADLRMAAEDEKAFRDVLAAGSGLVLVVGPAGAGRTTTMYAALAELHTPERALVTVERRMHRVLPGVDQVALDPRFGPSLARGLLPALAADPDAVLVDEIADAETAALAVEGAASRLVIAAVQASSARAAVRRLVDLGVDPAALASSVTAIVTQRLVRRICTSCRESYYPDAEELAELGRPEDEEGRRLLGRGRGCPSCARTGFRGQVGLFSVAVPGDEIRELASSGASPAKIERKLAASATRSLHDDGIRLCLDGMTTVAELRAAGLVDDL